jgi:hypothetical protein
VKISKTRSKGKRAAENEVMRGSQSLYTTKVGLFAYNYLN